MITLLPPCYFVIHRNTLTDVCQYDTLVYHKTCKTKIIHKEMQKIELLPDYESVQKYVTY